MAAGIVTTLSRFIRPLAAEDASIYTCTLAEFVSGDVFPVWYVRRDRADSLGHDDEGACPITFRDLAKLQNLAWSRVVNWPGQHSAAACHPLAIAMRCLGCCRTIVVDGNKRILFNLLAGNANVDVPVIEQAGREWPPAMPDMKNVCICGKG